MTGRLLGHRMMAAIEGKAAQNSAMGRNTSLRFAALEIIQNWAITQEPPVIKRWTLDLAAEVNEALSKAEEHEATADHESLKAVAAAHRRVSALRNTLDGIRQSLAGAIKSPSG